ncbi:hypothetical protein BDY24DRAFT_417090 [Mrakia frigida]|uniref:uncharacterized protein n=1 Tax=Mrakia frigida TaxID=29902 RepID=UPI003FCC09D4
MDDLIAALQVIKEKKDYTAIPEVRDLFRLSLWVTGQLVGSDESRSNSRKELKATVTALGLTSIWLTVNPPNTKSPILVKFTSGDSISLDNAFQLRLPTPNMCFLEARCTG